MSEQFETLDDYIAEQLQDPDFHAEWTDAKYDAVLKEIWRLWDAEPNTPEGDRIMALVTLVEAYESKHYPIPLPDPIEAIEYNMESRGMGAKPL